MSTPIDLGRPVSGDVIELILADHRLFESLLRDLRDSSSDRDAVRQAFSTLHVAHAEAEEKYVYPKLRRKRAIDEDEQEHGEEEHAEGHEALLVVLELKGTDTQAFDDAVEKLAEKVNHHLTEEELTILNPAREEVGEEVRAELGERFAQERNAQIDDRCGGITNVRAIVAAAKREGLLDKEEDDAS
jgi:hemerythrin superfamily protein